MGTRAETALILEYATQWSYGINETPNLFIPNLTAVHLPAHLSEKSETYKIISQNYQGADKAIQQMPTYWGPQSFTAGPMLELFVSFYFCLVSLFLKEA